MRWWWAIQRSGRTEECEDGAGRIESRGRRTFHHGAQSDGAGYAQASTDGSGASLSLATVVVNVVAGWSNPGNAALNGIVAALSITNPAKVTTGTAATVQVIVNALDPSGNTIVGPGTYADATGNPVTITLSDADASNSTTLSQSSVTQPSSGIALAYNGSSAFTRATVNGTTSNGPNKAADLAAGPKTGTIVEFPMPTVRSNPLGITSGPDGNLWFIENQSNKVGRITPSGAFSEFARRL